MRHTVMTFKLLILLTITLFETNNGFVFFKRSILAYGEPYYNLLFTLGVCNDTLIYKEQKIWEGQTYASVLDVHFTSESEKTNISSVNIYLVINNTNCFIRSEFGIGDHEFSATIFLPGNIGLLFYRIDIFICDEKESSSEDTKYELPFYKNLNNLQ